MRVELRIYFFTNIPIYGGTGVFLGGRLLHPHNLSIINENVNIILIITIRVSCKSSSFKLFSVIMNLQFYSQYTFSKEDMYILVFFAARRIKTSDTGADALEILQE